MSETRLEVWKRKIANKQRKEADRIKNEKSHLVDILSAPVEPPRPQLRSIREVIDDMVKKHPERKKIIDQKRKEIRKQFRKHGW